MTAQTVKYLLLTQCLQQVDLPQERIQMLKDKGVKNIHLMVIIAPPEGVKKMQEAHPDVDIYIGALDDHLNEHGYIVPGLGDAGDRIFGTK